MDRRSFVAGAAAASAASFALGPELFDGARVRAQGVGANSSATGRPNILVIKVDQLRYPSVFPRGVNSPDQFLQRFMPNLYELWQSGVKFTNHYTAASACTPARGTIVTGLYSQQSWLVNTILAKPYSRISLQPWLNPVFPTYGRLLRDLGYQTPFAGKWHVSIPAENEGRLEPYGFDGLSYPDPTGANLQGAYGDDEHGYYNDAYIASQAAQWMQDHAGDEAPWCLTVSLINPHDKEFFWAGTEFRTYNRLFAGSAEYKPFIHFSTPKNPPVVPWAENALKSPPPLGYPDRPPNWESGQQIAANKPSTQTYSRLFQELVWGGTTDDPTQESFGIAPYPPSEYPLIPDASYGIGLAPFGYWQRNLDSYTQIMTVADGAIGQVLQAFGQLPAAVRDNTVILFTSDHGEYCGAHGFLSGKLGSLYDEAFHVPLIVVDPSGRFAGDVETPRQGLTSSVDLLPLLVSLGAGGSRNWLTGELAQIYGSRLDLLPMLQSSQAPGRPYVLLATDEAVPGSFNFNSSPLHLVGMRTPNMKFGIYANWVGNTSAIADDQTLETEFYDYATAGGAAETENLRNDPRIPALQQSLLNDLIPTELRAPLPGAFGEAQNVSRFAYLAYDALLRSLSAEEQQEVLPYGVDF